MDLYFFLIVLETIVTIVITVIEEHLTSFLHVALLLNVRVVTIVTVVSSTMSFLTKREFNVFRI